ncbi:MAG: DNA polymerase [Oscillospiraceae bacterium]|nr:DNA polymerase [Oscillospiraceae bacterium]
MRLLSNKNGVYTNAITGFFSSLHRLRNTINPDCAAVAFDLRVPTFRHKMYDGYKKRRKGMPDELAAQMPYIKQILDLMGIVRVELAGYEADDIIGTLAKSCQADECFIATGDRDALQLADEKVSIVLMTNKEDITYTAQKIIEDYQITPSQFIEIKALMGDKSDDIPGVAGIGEVKAFSLIRAHKTIDDIYKNLDAPGIQKSAKANLEKDKDICFLSRELATIKTDVPIDTAIANYQIKTGEPQELAQLLTELELVTLMKRMGVTPTQTITAAPQEQDSPRILEIEYALESVLREMEHAGTKVDADGLRQFGDELRPQIEALQAAIHTAAGEEFNIASPKQLSEILFSADKLALPHAKKTKSGYSTDSDTLESLYEQHEIIPLVMEYRALTKLNATYVEGLLKCINPDTGRVHTTYKTETRTGRISSAEPNIQNIPVRTERGRVMRRFFVADCGNVLTDADYSQIELRVLAAISGDETLLEAFRNNADIHAITASQVFGVSQNSVTREMRSAAKAVNFGIVYGMGAFSLSKDLGVPLGQAKDYIERYLETYSGVRAYLERTVAEAKQNGYVKTMLGRVRYVPEINSSNHNIRAAGERIAKNTPIQGTAADIIKIAMIRVNTRLKELGSAKLILQIHDELIVETPESTACQVKTILEEEMRAAGNEVNMDLSVDIRTGKSWYETH